MTGVGAAEAPGEPRHPLSGVPAVQRVHPALQVRSTLYCIDESLYIPVMLLTVNC